MCKIICVTNRTLCKESEVNFVDRISLLSRYVHRIVLREKDLPEDEYTALAEKIFAVCGEKLVVHNFPKTAKKLGVKKLHLPLHLLRNLDESSKPYFDELGTSCHSRNDALEAVNLGCTYIFAGHIFETDCKKGLSGRGTEFLKEVVQSTALPVYAIGGINKNNVSEVIKVGAGGICVMSGLMTCDDVKGYIDDLKGGIG